MTLTDFHAGGWLTTIAVGFPFLAFAVWKFWRRNKNSLFWRIVICVIVATIIAPMGWSEEMGGATDASIFPAVSIVPSALKFLVSGDGSLGMRETEFLQALSGLLVEILIVTAVLAGMWAIVVNLRRTRHSHAA